MTMDVSARKAVLLAEKREACSEKLDHKPAMSQSYQGGASLELAKEHKGSQRIRQVNNLPQVSANETTLEESPIRHSWRPCQMLNQDGKLDSPRHHHPPTGRGPPRRRQWHPSGQGQTPGQASDLVLVMSPSKPDCSKSRDSEPNPVHQPRPAVARYRRHGDPDLSLKLHILRQPHRKMQNSSPVAKEREGPAEVQVQQHPSADHGIDQSRDRESPYQTPIAVVSPSHHSAGPSSADLSFHSGHSSPAEIEECKVEYEKEPDEVKEDDEAQIQKEDVWGHNPTINCSSCSQDDVQMVDTEELAESVEENQEAIIAYIPEKDTAQGSEITDLCSDTESTASLGIDGPPHSPPPLQLPTPPSSPDIPLLTQLVHFTEDTSLSPMPDYDPLPEEEDDEEYCSDSYSLSHFTSCSESYPKTYADFFSESHQNSYSEPVNEENSEPELHPQSFPGPFKSSYANLHRDPHKQSGSRTEPNEGQQEYLQEPHRHENVQNRPPSSCYTSKQGRDRGSFHFPMGRSVGCRLHHYDGRSDGEEDSADQITVPKDLRRVHRQADTQAKIKLTRQSSSGVAQEEQNMAGLLGEEDLRGSGDRITVAIKDIKEAIEEFKTKMVRSPYTPAKLVEPIWVRRQEFGPTEDLCPQQTAACHSSPHSPSKLKSPFNCTSVSVREPVSKLRAELTMAHHPQKGQHSQQGDTAMPQQPYVHIQQQMPLQQVLAQRPRPKLHSLPPQQPTVQEICRSLPQFPTFVDVPGPCDPEDLFDGIIFAATYLECTHLLSERTSTKSARMKQAQEAMSRVRAARKQSKKNKKTSPDNEVPSTVEVDLFMSTQRIKVLNADTQESIIDLPLRTISYIADIGNMVVLMARGKMVRSNSAQENLDQTAEQTSMTHDDRLLYQMICHVFESEDAQLIAQSIGQSFSVAYQEFLRANGIDPADLSQREYSDLLNTQDMYNDDLIHFSKSENCRDVYIKKQKGEILGVVIVESGWGSILPTVIIASMMHAGPAEKSGRLNIGDQIMTINGTSLVGLPLTTCQSIIKGLKSQFGIKMNIVRCPPVTIVLIRRPDLRYQLGFSVQNGIICSLMRGGIAERGGVRVGHRIIEINSQSVVATPHEKIVQILSNAVGQIHMKTMPAVMYRLLTAQEQPVYI